MWTTKQPLSENNMKVNLVSFGIKNGIPNRVSLIVDCRGIRDPHQDRTLRRLRGTDAEVQGEVLKHPLASKIVAHVMDLVAERIREGRREATIGIFCTVGHHRSVVIAEHVGELLRDAGTQVTIEHQDINR